MKAARWMREETESYDNTSTEIKAVDEHLKRLRYGNQHGIIVKPVTKAASGEVAVVNNAPSIIRVEPKLEKVSPLPVSPNHSQLV